MASAKDLDLASIKSLGDLQKQGKILREVANDYMDATMQNAPGFVRDLEKQSPVSREVVFASFGTILPILSVLILISYGAAILSAFVTVLQPLWKTYRALETVEKDDDTELLMFWMVHGMLYLAEHTVLLPVVAIVEGPYFLAKMIFLFWMLNFKGSIVVYHRFLAPFFRRHEGQAVELMDNVKEKALSVSRG